MSAGREGVALPWAQRFPTFPPGRWLAERLGLPGGYVRACWLFPATCEAFCLLVDLIRPPSRETRRVNRLREEVWWLNGGWLISRRTARRWLREDPEARALLARIEAARREAGS